MRKSFFYRYDCVRTTGQQVITEAKAQRDLDITARTRQIEDLIYRTFVSEVPNGHNPRPDVYARAERNAKRLACQGGPAFEQALAAVKFAWVSKEDHLHALTTVAD